MSSASPVVSAPAVSASETKAMKNIPQKYLKYMSYGLYLLKRICPHPEEYSARAIELLKLHNTVEEIVHDIDFILEGPLKTEMHEIQTIRKNFAKPPKKAKMAKDKPLVTLSQTCPLAAAIIGCAQQSTVEHIVAISDSDRSESDSETETEVKAPVSAPVQKKLKKVVAAPVVEPIVAAEQAVRNALADDKQKKEQEKARKEAEKALKEQEKEAEKLRKEQEKETEKLRKEQERAQKEQEKEAEKLRKEQEKLKKEQEKEAEKLRKEQEKLKKEAEKASKVKSIKPLTTELTAEPEK